MESPPSAIILGVCAVLVFQFGVNVNAVQGSGNETVFSSDPHIRSERDTGPIRCHHSASNRLGECRRLSACPSAVRDRLSNRHPQLCGFAADSTGPSAVPDVCCPMTRVPDPQQQTHSTLDLNDKPPTRQRPPPPSQTCEQFNKTEPKETAAMQGGRVAEKMCLEYQRQICNGKVSRAPPYEVLGGAFFVPADVMEYPHMALLGYGKKDNIQYKCGGSLISSTFVLTAAHCRISSSDPVRWVLLGALNRTSSAGDVSTRQVIEVVQVVVHPKYNPKERYHDVALLRLAHPANVASDSVRPACLHTVLDGDKTGELAVASGWGAQAGDDEEGSETLLKGNVTLRQLSDCDTLDASLPRGLDEQSMLCAGGDGVNPTDTCHGDSGGPLQLPVRGSDCLYRILGVVSFGPVCGIGFPGVYTRVAFYVPWIESVVWPRQQGGVCVPSTGPGTAARRVCKKYQQDFCQFGSSHIFATLPGMRESETCHFQQQQQEGRLEVAQKTEFPHVVQLAYGKESAEHLGCSGALISPRFVLTAAHCASLDCAPLHSVIFRALQRPYQNRPTREVDTVIVHPEYDSKLRYNDIALVRLKEDVKLGLETRPACLHIGKEDVQSAIAVGLVARGKWDFVFGEMLKTVLAVEKAPRCRSRLPPGRDPRLPRGVDDKQLCTGGRPEQSPFPGESGGPLQVVQRVLDNITVYSVTGVLSAPSPCSGNSTTQPDVYTNVANFLPWIESIVWPSGA